MKKFVIFAALLICLSAFAQNPAIRVEKNGTGTTIIFLPGFTTPGSVWNETIKNLKGRYQSHLVSYAGFNGISPIERPWYQTIKSELLKYIEVNKLSNINIVGHSMGGTLAMDIAAAVPDKVDKIILVDALPCMRELMMPGVPADKISYDNPYSRQLLSMSDEAFKQTAMMIAQSMTTTTSMVDTIANWSIAADRKTYVDGYTDLLKLDLRGDLAKIQANALVLGAPFPNKDIVKANLEKQYAALSNKEIEVADNGKHFLMFDTPDWFYAKVNSFLSK